MLAVTIDAFMPGGPIQVVSDDSANDSVTVVLLNNTVPGPGSPPAPVVTAGFSLYDQSNNLMTFAGQSFFPIDPATSVPYASGVQVTGATTNSTAVRIIDTLTALTNVTAIGTWNSLFSVLGQSGEIAVVNPTTLTVTTGAPVGIDGAFASAALKQAVVSLSALAIVAGQSAAVSADSMTLSTSTGGGKITLAGSVSATDLTISTNAAFDVSQNLTAQVLSLTANAGATQSGGTVTGSTSFSLTASGGGVTFNKAGNNLAKIDSINADGQDVVLNTIATVEQNGAILARSLALTAGGSVTLDNALNDLDSVAIKAGGNIIYTDANAVQVGVAGSAFGLTANSGVDNVSVTTANNLTQTTDGAIQAAQFTAKLLTGAGGGRLINLGSPNNQVGTFVAETTAFGGGGIIFVNAASKALTVGDGVNTIFSGSDISITTQGSGAGTLTLASPLSTPATITLASGGAITQAPGAMITADTLTVTNTADKGDITLDRATGGNNVAILAIQNNAAPSAAAKGISFTGSNAGSNNLKIAGTGVVASGGNIVIDSNGRPLLIAANISTVVGNVTLAAANGVSQAGGGISGNTLTVRNDTSGSITLTSGANDVAAVAIANNAAAGSVAYTDASDLTLTTVGAIAGISAGDSIALLVGGNFVAPAGTGLTTGGAGKIDVSATGTVTLDSASTAGAGLAFSGSGLTVNAALDGGATGSVLLTAKTAGVSVAAAVVADQDVVLTGPTFVTLKTGAAVTATTGRITATSTGGGFSAAAGTPLTAGTDVTVTSSGTASFGGPVVSGNDFVAKTTGAVADVIVNGTVNAGGAVGLTAGNAVTTTAAIVGNSFGSTSTGVTTLNGAVTTVAAITVVSGGSFGNKAGLTAGGALSVNSINDLLVGGAVQGSAVTLAAGNATSAADVTLKSTVTSTGGAVAITATGGALATATGGSIASAGDVTLAGTTGTSFDDAIKAGGNVKVTTTSGAVNFGAGGGIAALTKSVTLLAASGIVQDAASVGIQSSAIVATNTTSGAIALDNPNNDADTFRATNSAAGATLDYVDSDGIALALPGTSTSNGAITIIAGGGITVIGTLSSGSADTTLVGGGNVIQRVTGAITANSLGVDTSAVPGGSVTLNRVANNVAIIHGQTQGGAFAFTASGNLQIGVANLVDLVTTAGGDPGANIYVAAGQGGSGALLVAADSLDAGGSTIGLQAKSGISDLVSVTITSNVLALANTAAGNITLSSPTSAFANLAAISFAGSSISILDNTSVTLGTFSVGTLAVSGLQAAGGTIALTANGSISQTASGKVIGNDASFIATGTVNLSAAPNNNVSNLMIDAIGNVSYTDSDSFSIGIGGRGVVGNLGNIALVSTNGSLTINAEVSTVADVPDSTKTTLFAAGSITQTASRLISGDLVATAVGGSITLAQPQNDIFNLRASALAGNVTFVDFDDFEVGLDSDAVPGVPKGVGVFSGGSISLTAGPALSPLPVPAPLGPLGVPLLRVTEGLVWLDTLSLKAGLDSRSAYVDFAVTSTGDTAVFTGALRNMITYSNSNIATQTINGATRAQPMRVVFDEAGYPVDVITPVAALPAISKPLDINGTLVEQTVSIPRVGIDGSAIPTTSVVNGLVYAPGSNDSRITGLSVYGYATGSGIQFASAVNTIINTYAGLQRDGTTPSANKIGIELTGQTSTTNTIGTVLVNELAANVIGGNTYAGIVARNGSTGNAIVGNFIGTDAAGNDLGNTGFGISLEGVNGNVIGTRNAVRPDGTAAASNVIANNNNSGLRIARARAANANLGNIVENNLIDANGIDGIQITASAFQTIGGQQPRQANVITRQIGAPTVGGNGISVASSNDISIFANFIGVDEAGSSDLGNARAGVLVDGSTRTVISAGNRIGRNAIGVAMRNGAAATRVESNYIGTNEFDAALGNTVDGVAIDRSVGNFVRLGNVIANSGVNGVNITDATAGSLAAGNVVSGNTIRKNGSAGVGAGVRIAGGARTTVGGVGVGNVITSNANEGILVEPTSFTGAAIGISMQGNYIGTSRLEEIDSTLGNKVGVRLKGATNATVGGRNVVANSRQEGIRVEGSSGATIGSSSAGAGNVITRNGKYGLVVTDIITGQVGTATNQGNNVFGNTITGNVGGVLIKGTDLGNGVSTTSNVVVGTSAIPGLPLQGFGNTITGNSGVGVAINAAQSVLVEGNSIYGNTGIPISITNGGNAGAVAPTLTSATFAQKSGSTGQVTVQGTFATTGAGTVTVVNGQASFSIPQPGATVGSVVTLNGVGYRITQVISSAPAGSTVVQLDGAPSSAVAGPGRVASKAGVATFTVAQAPSLVGNALVVDGRTYTVTSLSSDGRTAQLAGSPTFLVSNFSTVQAQSFGLVGSSVLGQQYVIDLYLNNPGEGNPSTGVGYGMRTFLGRATVTVGPNGPGTFTVTINLPAGVIPAGQFITATASTVRSAPGTSPFSTSQASVAKQLVFAGPMSRRA
ncbi:MAG: hypothetical protein K8S94_06680 [Planctomycetia bacterium]|nr:hypothetical protein [Planctomycetia bacterium]